MNIIVTGIDYKTNKLDIREKLAFSKGEAAEISYRIKQREGIRGCIIVSTCNRTEIFISHTDNFKENLSDILIELSGKNDFNGNFHQYEGKRAAEYVIEVACGLHSQIFGESQIISQINSAAEVSIEAGASDCFLNKLFQVAVAAGKYMQTNIKISSVPVSSVYAAVELMRSRYGEIRGKKALVIGNGNMGKLAQKLLIENGCEVWVTLREYKNGNNEVFKGCKTIPYSRRYEIISNSDFVISATKSPHYTITAAELEKLEKLPDIIFDLAVPRDVEGSCRNLLSCFNIDSLNIKSSIDRNELNKIRSIIKKYTDDFQKWYDYKAAHYLKAYAPSPAVI